MLFDDHMRIIPVLWSRLRIHHYYWGGIISKQTNKQASSSVRMEKEKQKESPRRSSWPWKRKSSEKVAAANSFAPHEGGGTFLNSSAAVVEDRQQVLQQQQQQQQPHFPILLRSCRLCLRSIIHHLSSCTAAAAMFPKFFCLWFLQYNKSISIGAQYVTLEIYALSLGELETRDPSPCMSCKDHMWFVFPVWRTLCNVTGGWWCHSLSAWPYISGWGHWLWFFFMGFFFSFSSSWILVKFLKRKTKLFFHHFMYLSVASSRTCSAMIYNESVLFCCSLPCMCVSMQISLLCTGRNFPPWISSNRHMWGGWGGGITGGVDDAEMGCTSSWFLSASLASKGANLSVYSNFLTVFRKKELMSVFCCWGRSTLSGNSS